MPTKFEDALSIVGEEFKDDVLFLEKSEQEKKKFKSDVSEIIYRSIEEAEKEDGKKEEKAAYIDSRGYAIIPYAELQSMKDKIKKITDTPEIVDDEFTKQLQEMLSWISSYYEEKSLVTKDMGEMEDENMWKPFAGATSWKDAQAFMDAQELTENVYKAYGIFGALCQNIMCGELEITEKIKALYALVSEFRNILTPEKLQEMSLVEKAMKDKKCKSCGAEMKEGKCPECDKEEVEEKSQGGKDIMEVKEEKQPEVEKSVNSVDEYRKIVQEEISKALQTLTATKEVEKKEIKSEAKEDIPVWKTVIGRVENGMSKAMELKGNAKNEALQGLINEFGKELSQLVDVEEKSEISQTVDVEEIKKSIVESITPEMALIKQQMNEISNALKNLSVAKSNVQMQTPQVKEQVVRKAIVNMPVRPITTQTPFMPQKQGGGMSIADIVRKTTTG